MIRKEMLQVFRNKQMLPMIFVVPIVQVLLLTFAATFEIRNVDVIIVDKDNSTASREIIYKFKASKYFTVTGIKNAGADHNDLLDRGKAGLIIEIPENFEKDIINLNPVKVQLLINAVDASAAGLINTYANMIVNDFSKGLARAMPNPGMTGDIRSIEIVDRYRFNPEMDYKQYMAPGILVILVTFIGMFLTAMNVVKEKELGTIEQLNVTPIRKYQFIIGKLLPFWIIGLFILAFGLLLAKITFNVPVRGSLVLLFGLTGLYLMVVLSAALLISTITETQQQAMFISWFFVVVFIMLSGIFTHIYSMPEWAQKVAWFNPIAHFAEIIRRVLLKGAGFRDVLTQFWVLLGYGTVMLSLALWRYRKVTS